MQKIGKTLKIICYSLFFFFNFVNFGFCASAKTVRVVVLQGVSSLFVRVSGNFEIYAQNNQRIYKGRNLSNQSVTVSGGRIAFSVDKKIVTQNNVSVTILPQNGGTVYFNNRALRGSLKLIPKEEGRMLAVNELDVEDYCRGVLPSEVAFWWPLEALEAQAIIARTYALYHAQLRSAGDYDLTADIYSQVYAGKNVERWRTNRAVDKTRGKVLNFQGKMFSTYYHATCGGHTEDASNLWKVDIAPLKGMACSYCAASPHFRWNQEFSLENIRLKLKDAGFSIDEIKEIEIIDHNMSGRITFLEIKNSQDSITISAKDFRQALGPNFIRSTNFSLKIITDIVYFEGIGWGHGVGLCQWGAYGMAKAGRKAPDILKYYFPQAEIVSAAN